MGKRTNAIDSVTTAPTGSSQITRPVDKTPDQIDIYSKSKYDKWRRARSSISSFLQQVGLDTYAPKTPSGQEVDYTAVEKQRSFQGRDPDTLQREAVEFDVGDEDVANLKNAEKRPPTESVRHVYAFHPELYSVMSAFMKGIMLDAAWRSALVRGKLIMEGSIQDMEFMDGMFGQQIDLRDMMPDPEVDGFGVTPIVLEPGQDSLAGAARFALFLTEILSDVALLYYINEELWNDKKSPYQDFWLAFATTFGWAMPFRGPTRHQPFAVSSFNAAASVFDFFSDEEVLTRLKEKNHELLPLSTFSYAAKKDAFMPRDLVVCYDGFLYRMRFTSFSRDPSIKPAMGMRMMGARGVIRFDKPDQTANIVGYADMLVEYRSALAEGRKDFVIAPTACVVDYLGQSTEVYSPWAYQMYDRSSSSLIHNRPMLPSQTLFFGASKKGRALYASLKAKVAEMGMPLLFVDSHEWELSSGLIFRFRPEAG